MNKPKMLNKFDLKNLKSNCQEYLNLIEKGKAEDTDMEHYIFEAAIEAFFGKDVWDYINEKL